MRTSLLVGLALLAVGSLAAPTSGFDGQKQNFDKTKDYDQAARPTRTSGFAPPPHGHFDGQKQNLDGEASRPARDTNAHAHFDKAPVNTLEGSQARPARDTSKGQPTDAFGSSKPFDTPKPKREADAPKIQHFDGQKQNLDGSQSGRQQRDVSKTQHLSDSFDTPKPKREADAPKTQHFDNSGKVASFDEPRPKRDVSKTGHFDNSGKVASFDEPRPKRDVSKTGHFDSAKNFDSPKPKRDVSKTGHFDSAKNFDSSKPKREADAPKTQHFDNSGKVASFDEPRPKRDAPKIQHFDGQKQNLDGTQGSRQQRDVAKDGDHFDAPKNFDENKRNKRGQDAHFDAPKGQSSFRPIRDTAPSHAHFDAPKPLNGQAQRQQRDTAPSHAHFDGQKHPSFDHAKN